MKHTQGTWEIDGYNTTSVIVKQDNKWIPVAWADECITLDQAKANARLIASAPELLEALKKINKMLCSTNANGTATEVGLICEQAIAKAEGK